MRSSRYYITAVRVNRTGFLISYRIAEEELKGDRRESYGAEIIKKLSKELTDEYGKGFTKTNLYNFYSFYRAYPDIFHTVSGKSFPLLSWSHYRVLLQVEDAKAREWSEKEAAKEAWSVRTLQRNISSGYYEYDCPLVFAKTIGSDR